MVDFQKILFYWFGDDPDDLAVIQRQSPLWFGKDEQVDRQIQHQFEFMIDAVVRDRKLPVRQSLAQIILLDQLTRNIYRGQDRAFAFDPIALQMVLEGLEMEDDRQLRPVERVFYYLPLEHSEKLVYQNRSVELFQALADEVPEEWLEVFDGFLDYAIRHQVIIERFGRFPHRNAILGRASTAEELEFLNLPGSSF
jgi:uncharacterized protein (DUF924 family)